jgi:phosphoribosylamine--glycine ligase
MRILIIGEGGRESALAAKLQNDPRISKMFLPAGMLLPM